MISCQWNQGSLRRTCQQGKTVFALFSEWSPVKYLGCVRPDSVVKISLLGMSGKLAWDPASQGAATAVLLPKEQGETLPGWRWALRIILNQI